MPGPSDMELAILIKMKADLEALTKAKKGVKELGDEATVFEKKSKNSFVEAQKGLRGLLQPISMVRRTIFQLGSVWGLTAGAIVLAISDIAKKQEELNDISIKTGLSTEEISKKLYGFNIASKEAKTGVTELKNAQVGLGNAWTWVTTKITEAVGQIKESIVVQENYNKLAQKQGFSPNIVMTGPYMGGSVVIPPGGTPTADEQKALEKAAQEQTKIQLDEERWASNAKNNTKQLLLIKADYESKVLQMRGRDLESFKRNMDAQRQIYLDDLGPNSPILAAFDNFYNMQLERMELVKWGIRDQFQIMQDMQKQFGQNTVKLFGDVFIDALDNKLSGAKQIFGSFLMELRNMLIRAELEKLTASIITSGSKSNGVLGAIIRGIGTAFGGGSGETAGAVSSQISTQSSESIVSDINTFGGHYYAEGGIAGKNGPEIAMVGENGPEMVTPLSKLGNNGNNTTNVYYYITAVDAKSFADLVARNPNAIVAVTANAITRGKGLRKTIKEFS